MNSHQIQRALHPACAALFSGEIHFGECHKLTGGASAATWFVALYHNDRARNLILRLDAGSDQFITGVGKTAEAKAQRAAGENGAPVATVLHIFEKHPQLGNGYLMEALEGESLAPRILKSEDYAAARDRLSAHCAQALVRIHQTPLSRVNFLPLQDAATQLEELQKLHLSFGEALPVFSLAFHWLQRHIPACPAPALVHGDFRLGNLLVTKAGLNGVLDWELCHLGDPMEDIGWLCCRAWRFSRPHKPVGGFGERNDLFQCYATLSGQEIDANRVRYWELFANLKWGVICQYQAYAHLRGQVRSVERAAIGRRVAETEYDMMQILHAIAEQTECH
ncbi:phosphotransferase family protein [Ketobacter sp. MCCC 1A13808]|uniref:phosphotransferase family protein n=1 Tax=Ketobacter sp. MCCC 1A13808 TaxID=2602738 RepID=UPI0012EC65FB|nr:phosphotransferase family protein [Ketobacter sp. MCCC 1A13808]MVF14507.1 phosphotransferase family protein [Ketobacter sp. MCCC 1A13808]